VDAADYHILGAVLPAAVKARENLARDAITGAQGIVDKYVVMGVRRVLNRPEKLSMCSPAALHRKFAPNGRLGSGMVQQ
jgi:hypothetical protein